MNFVYLIIMFAILDCSICETFEVLEHKQKYSPKDKEEKLIITAIPTPNLKLNVFDKMLSEEMLSIKQYFHDRDSSHIPSVRITVKGMGATPTLEVKQKWPIKSWNTNNRSEAFTNDEVEQAVINSSTLPPQTKNYSSKNLYISEIKKKILELRSLPKTRAMRICDCMKSNPEPICTHRCTGMDASKVTNICKHSSKELGHECTRTTKSISTYPTYSVYPVYITHPTYFWGISTYTGTPYYHPYPINAIKISKTKRRGKAKKPHPPVDVSYPEEFQESNERYYNGMENYINSIESYDEDINELSKRKSSTVSNIASMLYDYDFTERSPNKLHFVNKDYFVNDVVKDLKEYYSDIVIKDCYCSLSSRNYTFNMLLYFFLLVHIYLHISRP